jgi:hypothetical protein
MWPYTWQNFIQSEDKQLVSQVMGDFRCTYLKLTDSGSAFLYGGLLRQISPKLVNKFG